LKFSYFLLDEGIILPNNKTLISRLNVLWSDLKADIDINFLRLELALHQQSAWQSKLHGVNI